MWDELEKLVYKAVVETPNEPVKLPEKVLEHLKIGDYNKLLFNLEFNQKEGFIRFWQGKH